jgi:ABC-2 type transport system ATP-binding protein
MERGNEMNTLQLDHITKTIKGKAILTDISLKAEGGKVYGIIGRNGSGKTMLFRAISGLMQIDSGAVIYNGKQLHKDFAVLPNLGLILEKCGLYDELTGRDNLTYLASYRKKAGKNEIDESICRVGLNPEDGRTYGKYSLGMKQRLAIAQAIMEKPEVILLDEPTNGLDQEGVEQIRKVIKEEKERGAIIFLASHNSEDIRMLSDVVYRMENGRFAEEAFYENR